MKRAWRGLAPLVALACLTTAARADGFDARLYAELLVRHTRAVPDPARTRVDYAALAHSADWKKLVAGLARADPGQLDGRAERLAFWINAYNVLAIDLVARNYPVESIRDLGSFLRPVWKREAGRVGGEPVTLDRIEHGILRPMGEPRIHAAIVCASVSCPTLRREPWRAGELDAQLDDSLRRWLADPDKGLRVDRERGVLRLSKVFDWFEGDFAGRGGVLAFLEPSMPDAARGWLAAHQGRVEVAYLDYDWRLNDLAPR